MRDKLKICIISSQILGFGKIGGFGSMTKKLAETLANNGYVVSVIVPIKKGQQPIEVIDRYKVYGVNLKSLLRFKEILKDIDADIYHSQNPNLFTYLAIKVEPTKKHVITCRDPRNTSDWFIEARYATWKRRLKTPLVYLFEDGPFISYAIRKADLVGCPAIFLKEKIASLYGRKDAIFLPNIEDTPTAIPQKSDEPTVCFVGRLDRRKRPELVFLLAKKFPQVRFLVVGKAEDARQQKFLEEKARKCPNVEMLGYLDKFQSEKIQEVYSKSWILLNTSAREGLPMTFIEAAGHGCAILSTVDPDKFASYFGFFATSTSMLQSGLATLLKNDYWLIGGTAGFKYVQNTYQKQKSFIIHENFYKNAINN